MRKIYSFGLAILLSASALASVKAEDRQEYALDKLANAQAQLDRLESQKEALTKLIKAVKKDLKAAKIRAKAERIQLSADTDRQDAAVMVEQSGVAVDLPNLMAAKGVKAGVVEYDDKEKEELDRMFRDKETEKAVFFPGGDAGTAVDTGYKGIDNDSDMPDYIK